MRWSVYDNPHRAEWFRQHYPEHSHMKLVTIDEEDWTNEFLLTPKPHLEKTYDLITINRIFVDFKNPDFFAKVLKTYEKKYDYRLKVLMPVDLDDLKREQTYNWGIKEQYEAFCNHFDEVREYIHFVPLVDQREMAKYHPESFADAIHELRNNYDDFSPRRNFLSGCSGRKWCLNQAIDNFDYYQAHLPAYQQGKHFENPWLDLAMHYNYQMGIHQFIYDSGINYAKYTTEWNWHMGALLRFYLIRFGFK